jgi:hypothetical protein
VVWYGMVWHGMAWYGTGDGDGDGMVDRIVTGSDRQWVLSSAWISNNDCTGCTWSLW